MAKKTKRTKQHLIKDNCNTLNERAIETNLSLVFFKTKRTKRLN